MNDEIIVGTNKKNTSNKSTSNKKKKTNRKGKTKNSKDNVQMSNKKNKITTKAKIVFGAIISIFLIILLLTSPLFDIKNIFVEGNSEVSDEKIISLSTLQLHTNIFEFNTEEIKEKIRQNAYVENVEITKKFPSTVQITIEERIPKYMLQFADSYVYINNQGYMLEISNDKLEIPILVGFTTDLSNIKAGNRINIDDLKKMDMVIKIYEAARVEELHELISKIDISNDKNYTIILDAEGKKVYLGDCTDLNTRFLFLKSILESSKGKSGEIFLNVDLNSQNAYFRPSGY